MKTILPSTALLVLSAASVMLIACGDGGTMPSSNNVQLMDNPVTASATELPVSATNSSASAFNFVNTMASSQNDSAEPMVDGNAVLATSETDEPEPNV